MRMERKYWLSIAVAVLGAVTATLAGQWLGTIWAVVAAAWCFTAGQSANLITKRLQNLQEQATALRRQVNEATKSQ